MHFLCFLPFVEQPDDHIGWATLLPFTWIYPTDPRTNSWNFCENILKIGGFEKLFWVGHFELFFFYIYIFFCFIPMKISQSFLVSKDGSKFWWLLWFLAQNNTCINIYATQCIYSAVQPLFDCTESSLDRTHTSVTSMMELQGAGLIW